jgi:excinuclease UvrABC nuclease subunit
MPIDFDFREQAVRKLTTQIGVYVLCDLDNVPVYVGKSRDGVRARVRRHLTSARSDIIANRQIDVWEIAYVMAYPVQDVNDLANLEALLFHHFDPRSTLMQGQIPAKPDQSILVPEPSQLIQVMSDDEIKEKA